MKVVIFDYATGNLHSLVKAFEHAGASVSITDRVDAALESNLLVLPGVGAFAPAAERLQDSAEALRRAADAGFPMLGICLGMQLLFETSEEGAGRGLGVLRGAVRKLKTVRTPHMGWNRVECGEHAVFADLDPLTGYYANSYVADPAERDVIMAWTGYERERFPAVVRRGNTWGIQFHPEKSGAQGLRLIRNFLKIVPS
ncbi:MAG: imidazole glycerol phosphate synthase subunit HisH [Gemmatimonadota bacterium]